MSCGRSSLPRSVLLVLSSVSPPTSSGAIPSLVPVSPFVSSVRSPRRSVMSSVRLTTFSLRSSSSLVSTPRSARPSWSSLPSRLSVSWATEELMRTYVPLPLLDAVGRCHSLCDHHRFHDCRLVQIPLRPPRPHLQQNHQRGPRHQQSRLRYLLQASRHH